MRHARRAGVLVLLLVPCACVDAPAPDASFAVDTVAGIVTVRNAARPITLDTAHIVSIGSVALEGAGAPDEFGAVNSIVADAVGNVYVADGRNIEVRVFDSDGTHLRSFGRRGGGPGEFQILYSLAWMGDTLLALDPGNARVALLSRSGEQLGTWRWMALTGSVEYVRFFPTGLHEAYVPFFRRDASRPNALQYVRLTSTGPADTVALDRPTELTRYGVLCEGSGMIAAFTVPFAPGFLGTPAPDHGFVAAHTGVYRIASVGPAGDTTRVLEADERALPVREESWDSLMAEYAAWRDRSPGLSCTPAEPVRPPTQPVVRGIFFDLDGTLIVEALTTGGLVYDFFDADGVLTTRAPAPERDLRVPPFFRDGVVWVVARDSLDVQTVHAYRLTRENTALR